MVEKKRGDEASSTTNKLILKKAAYKKVDRIMSKAFISEREVYDLIRSFFKKHLTIDYEFTHEELMKELKKVYLSPELQEKVRHLFEDVSEIEHTSKTYTREELERILEDFRLVVDGLIVSHYQQERSFFKKLKDNIHKMFSRKHKKLLEQDDSVLSESERVIVKMNMLLDNARRLSDSNLEKAMEAYQELISIYDTLGDAKKKVYYKPVQELYNMLNSKQK
jgi:hypothetical protein